MKIKKQKTKKVYNKTRTYKIKKKIGKKVK